MYSLKKYSKFYNNFVKFSKKKVFELISPEEYMFIQKRQNLSLNTSSTNLKPLMNKHDSNTTKIKLIGVPKNKLNRSTPQVLSDLSVNNPDIILLQIDPMPYIVRQRFLTHKLALHGVEDYSIEGVEDLNYSRPITWEECIVNLLTLDMAQANQINTKLDYTKGFMTYSYGSVQLQSTHDNLTEKFIGAITNYIIADKWSPYFEINNILYECLMGKQKVILGDMPEILLRQILGNSITINEARDIFKIVLSKVEELGKTNTFNINGDDLCETENDKKFILKKVTNEIFSHIFQAPKDLYMTSLISDVALTAFSTLAYVGSPHFIPIQKYWIPPPIGINFTQATKIPSRIENETNDDLIEKQVIFEVLFGTRVWAEKYVFNPFLYINNDITKIENLDELKKTFYLNLKKYEMFRDEIINSFLVKKLDYESKNKDKLGKKETLKLTSL